MNKEDREEVAQALATAMNRVAASVREDMVRLGAAHSAMRFLLEQLYANAYIGNPAGFDSLMNQFIELTRKAPATSGSMDEEAKIEAQAQVCAQLERFRLSVLQRLQQDNQRR